MARVLRTPAAERSLDAIFDHIGREHHSSAAAARFLRKIADRCALRATQPLSGEARPDLAPRVGWFPVDHYVVLYEPLEDGILLLLVVHGSRDIPAVFRHLFR